MEQKNNKMQICMVSDCNQINYSLSNSIHISKNSKKSLNIYIIFDKLNSINEREEQLINNAKNIIGKYGSTLDVIVNDSGLDPIYKSNIENITNSTFTRLKMGDILPSDVKGRVLYLDNDIFVDGDISEILSFKCQDDYTYAVSWKNNDSWILKEHFKKLSSISKFKNESYFNAGVIYFDIDYLRKNKFSEESRIFWIANSPSLPMADQDIINGILPILEFEQNFNIARNEWKDPNHYSKLNLKIYHFLSHSKPWISDIKNIEKINDVNTKGTLKIEEYDDLSEAREKWRESYMENMNEIKNTTMNKDSNIGIKIICPISNLPEHIFESTLRSIQDNSEYIKEVIFVKEESSNIDDNFIKENLLLKNTILKASDRTTKTHKLNLAKHMIYKNDYLIVLDSDDKLFNLEFLMKNLNGKIDLLLMNYIREQDYPSKNEQYKFLWCYKFDKPNCFPYFGNHSTLVKGSLFTRVFDFITNTNFQRHEDTFRTLLYISKAKEIKMLDSNMICRRVFVSESSALKIKDNFLIAKWMVSIIENFLNFDFVISENEILSHSQIAAIYEINSTIKKVGDYFENKKLNIIKEWNIYLENLKKNDKVSDFFKKAEVGNE